MQTSKNRMSLMITRSDFLAHHGIMGQRWGKRNGPPYPLAPEAHSKSEQDAGWQSSLKNDKRSFGSSFDKKVAKAEEKRQKAREKALKKARKVAAKKRSDELKDLKRQLKDEKQAAKIAKMKQKLLQEGDLSKISKKSKYFTNEELQYAQQRAQLLDKTKNPQQQQNNQQNQKKPNTTDPNEKLKWLANNLSEIGKVSTSIMTIASNATKIRAIQAQWRSGDSKNSNSTAADANIDKSDKSKVDAKSVKTPSSFSDAKNTKVSDIPDTYSPKYIQKLTQGSPFTITSDFSPTFYDSSNSKKPNYTLSTKTWKSITSTKLTDMPSIEVPKKTDIMSLSTINQAVKNIPSMKSINTSSLVRLAQLDDRALSPINQSTAKKNPSMSNLDMTKLFLS